MFRIIIYGLVLITLSSCGGGGKNPGNGGNSDTWVAGSFEPASNYVAKCAVPRTGINPFNGSAYSDVQGTLLSENTWLRSWSNKVYLWYNEIQDLNPANYNSTSAYFPLLKTTATTVSGKQKDEFHFAYSSDDWYQLSQSGVSAGYGATWTIFNSSPRRVVVAYTEPGSPATGQGILRGTEILEIDGVDVADGSDVNTLNAGLFPASAGETHTFSILDPGATTPRSITLASASITSEPVQNVGIIDTPSGKVGYLVFNSHIATAEQGLANAFEQFDSAGVVDLVLDLRYNGGGFLYIASQLSYMIAGSGMISGKVFENLQFNNKHPSINPITGQQLAATPFYSTSLSGQSLPTLDLPHVFVITGNGTCSASEAVINGLRGIDIDVIQIGSSTCGKPFGFYPTDNCGTTWFTINFKGVNDKGFGDYPDGFSPVNTLNTYGVLLDGCSVADDYTRQLGDPAEGRLAAALDYRVSGGCPNPSGKAKLGVMPSTASFAAVDGITPKPLWLENRIMRTWQ